MKSVWIKFALLFAGCVSLFTPALAIADHCCGGWYEEWYYYDVVPVGGCGDVYIKIDD